MPRPTIEELIHGWTAGQGLGRHEYSIVDAGRLARAAEIGRRALEVIPATNLGAPCLLDNCDECPGHIAKKALAEMEEC